MSSNESAFTINDISQLMETLQKLTKQESDKEPASQESVNKVLEEIKRLKRDVRIAVGSASFILAAVSLILALAT